MANLRIRKLADQAAPRVKLTHPVTSKPLLYTPEDGAVVKQALEEALSKAQPTPRPFLGVKIEGEAPQRAKLPMSFVEGGIEQGWISVEGEEIVRRSGGPPALPWKRGKEHTFLHVEKITIDTVDGPLVYRVIENPDKWPAEKDGAAGFGGEVRWYYEVELEATDG